MEVLYNVAGGVILSLGSSTVNEIGLWLGVTDELDKLRRTVGTIEAVLLHAEEQSLHNPQLKHWLGLLSEAFYDAEDLLDEFSYEALHQQVMGGSQVAKKVRLFFSSSNQFVFGLKMGHKVRELRQRLDEIAAEKNKFHLEEQSVVERSFVPMARYQTHSSPPQIVIGREHEKEEIVQLLLSSDFVENVSVVSIVGIGGLGKTTFTQMVYNDDRVKSHFELKMWVCVSDDFDVQLLVKKVLESVTRENVNVAEMDPLKNILHEKINGRSYLLVLDDVWNEDVNKWSSLRDLLAGGARGSKIVITTRLRTVAEMSRPIHIHELNGLSKNESWSLFEQVAFKQGEHLNLSLEAMGREIVEKCCGVPLAIKTIGGVLYFKDPESEWALFKDNELAMINVFKNDILPILKLSYNHLPPHYKHCLAYCALFSKNFKIPIDIMIQLWKAHGYLKSTNLNECLQDIGLVYFKDLFRMSFFQDVEKDEFGNLEYRKMHDVMHDLAISVVGDNFYASHFGIPRSRNNPQHMFSLSKAKKVRTMLTLDFEFVIIREFKPAYCNMQCLRVLDLSRMGIRKLRNSFHKLKHLRYLDLSLNQRIRELPDSITNLYNLQVLKFRGCENLMQLPRNITKLVNLTDLDNSGCEKLCHMPQGIGKLTRLEKLSEFVIAKNYCTSKYSGGLDELHSLNNLRGELKIMNLRYAKNAASEFTKARLSLKQKLQKLTLNWGRYKDKNNNHYSADEEMGMEALCPHPNLKQLTVLFYRGVKPPSWLLLLTNLVSVSFEDCRSIEWLPPLNQLPRLKKLEIRCLTNLKRLENRGTFSLFPFLTHLNLTYCTKLECIDVENGRFSSFFPSLTHLTLFACPNLKGFERQRLSSTIEFPYFPRMSQLQIFRCPKLT